MSVRNPRRVKTPFGVKMYREKQKQEEEEEYIKKKYHGRVLKPKEIKALNKRRVAYAKKYNKDAIKGIPRGY